MYHKLLQKQIDKFLPADYHGDERLTDFLASIHASYSSQEQDRALIENAFRVSETEFKEVNGQLNTLAQQRLETLKQLNQTVNSLVGTDGKHPEKDNLVELSERIKDQVHRNKVTEENLNRHVKLFKTLLTNLQSGVLVESEDRKILFTNDTFCSLFHIPAASDDLVGMDCSSSAEQTKDLFKDPEGFVTGIHELLRNKKAVYNEVLETVDGKILERDYVPIWIDGLYKGHLWEYTNVTEKVRYQQVLRESEERNRLVLNSSLDAIVIADDKGAVQYWNPRAEKLFGWTQEEVIGQQMGDLFIPSHLADAHHRGMARYLMTSVSHVMNQVLELSARNKDGKEFPIELIVVTYQQQGRRYFCGFMKDISVRKQSINRLKSQEEKFRNIIANMNLGLLEVNKERTIRFANQSFCDISGYTEEELVGNDTDNFLPAPLGFGTTPDGYELGVRNKQGDPRWWFVSTAPNYNDTGELVGAIGIFLDITNQKQLESELAVAKTKAEEGSVAKEAFLANMSHEIRTPLNAIIGMIRELSREELSPKQQTYLDHTDTAARHLLSIVNSILDLSKIEAGELELDDHDFSLEALIANMRSILNDKAQKKGISLQFDLDDRIWPAHTGDSSRLRQVVINLLDNAIKFTLKGGVRLEATAISEEPDGQRIRLKITDTGIGMDEQYLGQLFSKFSQAEKSTSRRFGGTGLGMSITKQIVEMMGGTIAVDSKKDRGTTFTIELKLAPGNIEQLADSTEENLHLLRGTHVLLVEDNMMNRFIATKSLSHLGCTVDEAENGAVALDMLKKSSYDVILMDIQMPELDGVETTKIIRNELQLHLPIIAVTANAFKKDIDLYLSIGMNDYVTKPFEEQVLFDTLLKYVVNLVETPPQLAPAASGTVAIYDLTKLRELSRGDEQFVESMVEIFTEHTPLALTEISEAMHRKDYETVAKTAHRIKPSIESMGIVQIEGLAKDIECYGKSADPDHAELTAKVDRLTDTLVAVIDRLRTDFSTLK
ncbi:PAS domain S-box-containing protein [Neolewinella xylanilytica]|uniref:histidine kinase n=1 Tax=Neolewinella xylanilytica TaxID=1514080 RepID=A0A2S6I8L0_9BACT|nr:PAS domain S-box protein [Neolewinella xylanilytica]PPK87834.1 PAS domain S-box-containing protein [Neolewinella xylanilytica]